jgi:exonuclease SbcD
MPENSLDQHSVITAAMDQVRTQIKQRAEKGRRSVVISHTFAAGAEKESSDSERSITRDPLVAGGIDNVPVTSFKGADYVALGHIHGRSELAHNIRYSGAVVHYSFKEAGKARGGWLVDLEPGKDAAVEWVDFPIFRNLIEIKGSFAEIMTKAEYDKYVDHYVRVVYTDNTRELDAMRKLKERFPYCAEVIFEPANVAEENTSSYRDRIKGKTDVEIMSAFLVDVRNGEGPSNEELKILKDALDAIKQEEAAK